MIVNIFAGRSQRSHNLSRAKRKERVFTNTRSEPQDQNLIQIKHYLRRKQQVVVVPRNLSQEHYVEFLKNPRKHIVFAIGPAGTGKTMLAVQMAIKLYKEGEVSKIIVTRPAVSVDEEHGFLPGDLNAKMAPWTRPIMDVFAEYYRPIEITKMLEEQIIEVSPLAFMRGRTFKKSWIIADEMQNATPSQMKMLLTRLGDNSKMVVTGDTQQADRKENNNGLLDFKRLVAQYENCKFVAGVEFAGKDIHRHSAVVEILKIYGEI